MPLYTFSGTPLAAVVANRDHLLGLAPQTRELHDMYAGFLSDDAGLWARYLANADQCKSVRAAWDALAADIPLRNVLCESSPLVPLYSGPIAALPKRHPVQVPTALLLVLGSLTAELRAQDGILDAPLPTAAPIIFDSSRAPVEDATLGEILAMLTLTNVVSPVADPRFHALMVQPHGEDPIDALMLLSAEIGKSIQADQCCAGIGAGAVAWHALPLAPTMDAAAKMVRSLLGREQLLGNGRIF